MIIKLIIALDNNGVMGINNHLPWCLRDDLKHFKVTTNTFPLIMGSNTFKSLPRVLPNREHIVLSNTLLGDEDKSVFTSIKEVVQYIDDSGYTEVFVIGGANVIKQFVELNLLDELIITHVDANVTGDVILDLDEDIQIFDYICYNTIEYKKDDYNEYDFKIKYYKKKKNQFYQ